MDAQPPHDAALSADRSLLSGGSDWSAETSQELLRLRFRQLRGLFDDAQTVAEVHEAWSVVASTLNAKRDGGLRVDAIKCSEQLMRLRQQWQQSSAAQLHLMMAECFGQSAEAPQSARKHINRALEGDCAHAPESERARTTGRTAGPPDVVSPPRDLVALTQTDPLSTVGAVKANESEWCAGPPATVPESSSASANAHSMASCRPQQVRVGSESALAAPPLAFEALPDLTLPVTLSAEEEEEEEEEEFPRQDEIARAMERQAQQLEKLSHAHQCLAGVTQQLMEALDTRRSTALS
ncbi:unnamed protein product [Hyaloperonospora brassicae]|uniref:Uncharacterized protein n=1 Tax=Hyaloperonospora brassicae TaxID=162125 RepID=A0AAV0U3F5_HYABA|nr:unnamed protein product [Hyaloperonospora brassicae]